MDVFRVRVSLHVVYPAEGCATLGTLARPVRIITDNDWFLTSFSSYKIQNKSHDYKSAISN